MSRTSRKGFTLIELLVVIAIIAILAAILFPVFAQAREKARSIACLSNCKQIGLALVQYTQDYDEYTQTVFKGTWPGGIDGTGYTPNWYVVLMPYIKSWAVFDCPDRGQLILAKTSAQAKANKHALDPYKCWDNINPTGECLGYGINDGLVSDSGYGSLQTQYSANIPGQGQQDIRPGRNIAQFVSPAQMVIYGDSYDNPGMSIAMDNIFSTPPNRSTGTIGTSALRHNQLFNFVFADGHAHTIRMLAADYPGYGEIGLPASEDDADDWCYSPTAVPASTWGGPAGGYPVQSGTEPCAMGTNGVLNGPGSAVNDLYTNSSILP